MTFDDWRETRNEALRTQTMTDKNDRLLSEMGGDNWHEHMLFWTLDWILFLPLTLARRQSKPVRLVVLPIIVPWFAVAGVLVMPVFILEVIMDLWEDV